MRRGPSLRYYHSNSLDGLSKATKNLNKDSRSPFRNLNPGLPEYEVGLSSFG
jgi:hypothetical protein